VDAFSGEPVEVGGVEVGVARTTQGLRAVLIAEDPDYIRAVRLEGRALCTRFVCVLECVCHF
jgi:hypothetical protein